MKFKMVFLCFLLSVPLVAAVPSATYSDCAIRIQVSDGRTIEGSLVAGERADFLLPCVSKKQMAKVIRDLAADSAQKTLALNALDRASDVRMMLVPEVLEKAQH